MLNFLWILLKKTSCKLEIACCWHSWNIFNYITYCIKDIRRSHSTISFESDLTNTDLVNGWHGGDISITSAANSFISFTVKPWKTKEERNISDIFSISNQFPELSQTRAYRLFCSQMWRHSGSHLKMTLDSNLVSKFGYQDAMQTVPYSHLTNGLSIRFLKTSATFSSCIYYYNDKWVHVN